MMIMKWLSIFTTLLTLLSCPSKASDSMPYNMPRVETISLPSVDGRQYDLYVKLPPKYFEATDKAYPVLYFTDAVWHIEALSAISEYQMEDVILVGISWQKNISASVLKEVGEYVSRFRDYSISPSPNPKEQAKYQFGQAQQHLSFMRDHVIKYIQNNYRTLPNNRTYFGYSLGGAFGAYTLLTQPDTFQNYILGSPSLGSAVPILNTDRVQASLKKNGEKVHVFVSYGTLEKKLAKQADQFINLLKTHSGKHIELTHEVVEGSHQTAFPLTGVRSINWLSELLNSRT